MVTELPKNSEEVTKLLRSKGRNTDDIVNIVSKIDKLEFYFPNKESFILELIQDRWNDQRLINFKIDYRIWSIFNTMWTKINDERTKKKLFKSLKLFPI
ncbi:hypothetical protein Kpol_170p1, partial [Vanderwaltozyma polyspora DSM 70294]